MTSRHMDALLQPIRAQRNHISDLRSTIATANLRAALCEEDEWELIAYRAARQLYRAAGMRETWAYWADKDMRREWQ